MENNILKSNITSHAGDFILPTAKIKNDPIKETVYEVVFPCTEDEKEKNRKKEEMILKKRAKNFSEGVDLFKNFQKVNIDEMNYVHQSLPLHLLITLYIKNLF